MRYIKYFLRKKNNILPATRGLCFQTALLHFCYERNTERMGVFRCLRESPPLETNTLAIFVRRRIGYCIVDYLLSPYTNPSCP